jgi:hypothetical protein
MHDCRSSQDSESVPHIVDSSVALCNTDMYSDRGGGERYDIVAGRK